VDPRAEVPPRVSLIGLAPSDPVLVDVFERIRARGAGPLNMHRALAHAPRVFRAWVGMAHALREQTTTPRHARELVILRVLHVVGGDYELAQHRSMALGCGLTAAQVEAVTHWRDADVFDGRQRVLLAYVDELVSANSVDDATFAALGEYFDEQEIVELTLTGAFYVAAATVTRALNIQVEPDAGRTEYESG